MWLPCFSLSSRACSNSCPMSWWSHSIISSFVVHFSSWLQSLPASVQLLSCIRLFVTPWTAACQASLFITNSRSLLKLMSIVLDAIQPSHPLWSPSPPAFNLSQQQGLSTESVLIRWPKYWSFSFNISPPNKYSGLISFRIAWFDLVAVQGDPQESSTTPLFKSIWHSVFFMFQLSYPYMTTGKAIALTWQTFVGKVMSLLSSMLSRFVIAFLWRSKCLLIS